jgi:hypothetical protein
MEMLKDEGEEVGTVDEDVKSSRSIASSSSSSGSSSSSNKDDSGMSEQMVVFKC